jgi:hypothetical protein
MSKPNRSHGRLFGAGTGAGAGLLVVAMLVGACGGPAAPGTTSPSGAPSAPGATATTPAGEPSPPTIDISDLAGSMATAEAAQRQEDRQRAGLVDLGPGALELAAAMDAATGRALTTTRDDAAGSDATGNAAAGFGRGGIAAVGPVAVGPEPGFNAMVVWALLITSLDGFAKGAAENGTVEAPPETIEVAGNTGTIRTTMTVKVVTTGSKLSVDVTMKAKGQVADRTGAILYAIDSTAMGHVDVDFCPDASGHAPATIKLTSSEIYTQGGGSLRGVSKEFSGTVAITVDDQANISRVEGTSQGAEDAKGGISGPAGGETTLTASTRTASDNIANDGDGRRLPGVPRNIQLGGEGSTPDQQGKLWGSTVFFVETMVTAAANEAEKLWREGKCVEVTVDPEGGDVDASSTTEVTATVRHLFDGGELDKPVVATLTNVKSIEPAGEEQPAPATVTYTAGPNVGDYGRINFKSTSNRGIGEKTVTFTVQSGWTTTATDPLGSTTGTKCGGVGGDWVIEGTQDLGGVLTVTTRVVVSIDETTLQGTFDFHKDQVGGGTLTIHQSNGAARVVQNEDGSVTMTLDAAPVTLTTTTQFGSQSVEVQADELTYPWTPAPAGACSQ